jgi:pyruvate/2-oxoglutarate dehydrogenase complex dihydrolipoamide dehydrogenase (E3) component
VLLLGLHTTKALLRSPAALRAARQLPGAREAVTGALDVAAVLRRRDSFASNWKDDGQASWLGSAGIALYRGQGRISSERVVEVTSTDGTATLLTARHAVRRRREPAQRDRRPSRSQHHGRH